MTPARSLARTFRFARFHVCVALLGFASTAIAVPAANFVPQGFGGLVTGGQAGPTLYVTRLDDNPSRPAHGTFRWAVQQSGARIVRFRVAGNIALAERLVIEHGDLTIDGSDAPGAGICIRDHGLELKRARNVIVRNIRIRRGDVALLKHLEARGLERPAGSTGLDCVSIDDCEGVLFDRVSLSWSCDEIFGIVRSRNVTIQWCILSEPLANPRLHPYGDNHGFGLNLSASTVSIHHSLIAHYVMRGPQFEANDMRNHAGYDVQLESANNLIFDYTGSGARYSGTVETSPSNPAGVRFLYHFVNNRFINSDARRPEIEVITRHSYTAAAKVYVHGNLGPNRPDNAMNPWVGVFLDRHGGGVPLLQAHAQWRQHMSDAPLFTPPVSITLQTAAEIFDLVLDHAGCSHARDAVDARIVRNVRLNRFTGPIRSQRDVGGWPNLARIDSTPGKP